ncbi:MAG: hypothetical protein QXZ03_04375 [Nitrososphaerota archaeon]
MSPRFGSDARRCVFLRNLYVLLVLTGISSNSLAFLYSHHVVSSGMIAEASPHMGELMAYPIVAWLTGFLVHIALYAILYWMPGLSSYIRPVLASSITALSIANLTHDLTVTQQSNYLHMLATLIPAVFTVTFTAVLTLAYALGDV